MDLFAILCTGPSLTLDQVQAVRGMRVIAVNNAFELAPDAEALIAQDSTWWKMYPQAKKFAGRKFSTRDLSGVEQIFPTKKLMHSTCSGVVALEYFAQVSRPDDVCLLLGADMRGTHYFGRYTNGLSNTTDERRQVHHRQFSQWRDSHPKAKVFNCTPGSALACFPMSRLEDWTTKATRAA